MKKVILTFITLVLVTSASILKAQDGRFDVFLYDIKDAQDDINLYTNPKDRTYLIRPVLEEWLFRAVSKKAREEWVQTTQLDAGQKQKIYSALDALSVSAARKLPLFTPGVEKFALGTEEEKEMLKTKINGISEIKIHKIGIEDRTWRIEKNDDGIPTGRRRWGYVWFKKNNDLVDYPWCRTFEMYLYQPYQGGGTYGSTEAYFERRWLCGCPK